MQVTSELTTIAPTSIFPPPVIIPLITAKITPSMIATAQAPRKSPEPVIMATELNISLRNFALPIE